MNNIYIFFFLFIFGIKSGQTQSVSTHEFVWSVAGKHYVSDNFGEIRPNHFHTGIDISASFGEAVYSVGEGSVWRIKISGDGYGTALYIKHPNGFTSVYAHLSALSPEIEHYVSENQYQNQSFEQNLYPQPEMFPVRKGQIIGRVGNSGRSYSPHVHFEIRNSITENPQNPLLFYRNTLDFLPPRFSLLGVYPLSKESSVNGSHYPQFFKIDEHNKEFGIRTKIKVTGKIGFAIQAADRAQGGSYRLTVYAAELFLDDTLQTGFRFDELSFETQLDVNSFCDYPEYQNEGKKMMKLFSAPGFATKIYSHRVPSGILSFSEPGKHEIKILARDEYQNQSSLTFDIESMFSENSQPTFAKNLNQTAYDSAFYIVKPNFRAELPPNTLYENSTVYFSQTQPFGDLISDVFTIGNSNIPVANPYNISIKPKLIGKLIEDKAIIVRILNNGTFKFAGGTRLNGFLSTKTINFGAYAVLLDTVSPKIEAVNFPKDSIFTKRPEISFKISDNLSGIDTYSGFIDSQWVLFCYDAKNSLISYKFDNHLIYNKYHTIQLHVRDKKNNESIFLTKFYR